MVTVLWWRGSGICQGARHLPSPGLPGPPSSGLFSSVLGTWGQGSGHLSPLCPHSSPWAAPAPLLLGQGHSQTCPYLRRGREPNLPPVEAPRQRRTLFPGVGADATDTYDAQAALDLSNVQSGRVQRSARKSLHHHGQTKRVRRQLGTGVPQPP